MSDRIQPLAGERQPRETTRAVLACNDWLRLGVGRSLPGLLEQYAKGNQKEPPTEQIGTLKKWSARYDWTNRAELYDAEIEAERDAVARAYASEITEEGLALIHERVKTLKELAARLLEDMEEVDKVWLKDVKQIGSGDMAERVDLIRFNAPLFQQLRGVLDDIAKEMGHRVQKVAPTTPDGKESYDPVGSDLREAILSRLSRISESSKQGGDSTEPQQ